MKLTTREYAFMLVVTALLALGIMAAAFAFLSKANDVDCDHWTESGNTLIQCSSK